MIKDNLAQHTLVGFDSHASAPTRSGPRPLPRLPLAPVLARASLRSSLALAFGCSCLGCSSAQLLDADHVPGRIAELGDWRGETLARVRELIKEADPDVVEEWKWRGVPVWSHDGIICTGETYKNAVKMTFMKGAALEDPSGLFNSSLDGNTRRAIDFHEGDKIDEKALKALVRAAVTLNASRAKG